MIMRHYTVLALSCLAVLGLAACAPSSASNERATYKAVPLKGDPAITFNTADATGDTLLIDITSPTGIGSAAIEKTAGQWPLKVVMRLHVKGLESFKFRYADILVDVAVSSHGDQTVNETYQQAGQTRTTSSGDPYWIAVTPGEGYFDLEAPSDFLKSGEDKFTIEWIDFYR
jgi:hypothetical protein